MLARARADIRPAPPDGGEVPRAATGRSPCVRALSISTRNGTSGSGRCRTVRVMEVALGNCAGIDWASEKHDVLVQDAVGEELLAATFAHDEDGVRGLCAALVRFEVEVVAIERPDGLLVDRLLEAGVRVLALHPNQVKAARDRFRASGGKSDRFDCFVLCELARTDRHRFRILEPDSDQTKAVRALVRAREDLVGARVALANQLRCGARAFLARPDRSVLRSGQPDLARVPGPVSQPRRRARAG